jgi:hypothetical protein
MVLISASLRIVWFLNDVGLDTGRNPTLHFLLILLDIPRVVRPSWLHQGTNMNLRTRSSWGNVW